MSELGARTVLAIDPGSAKCGMALVKRDDEGHIVLLWRRVCPTGEVLDAVAQARLVEEFAMLVVGSGTTSRTLIATLRDALPGAAILVVDEKDTTLHARERYWVHHPRRGWRRLLPATMQTPPEPVDDFVALILAERVLSD